MAKYKKHRPMCHMILLTLMISVLCSTALGLDTTNSQEKVKQVKYRHRRENDEDENFIALAPADGDEFNLESVLNKDKQMPAIVRLDPVSDQEEEEGENDDDNYYGELSTKEENGSNKNNENDKSKNYDADKFNRFFDSVDLNEEQKRVFNESLNGDDISTTQIFGRIADDDTDDYLDSTTVLTTSTTSTISPYVREIYKTSSEEDEEENDEEEELQLQQQQHNRNHHSKFKMKHTRKHHKKHHAQPSSSSYHLPGVNEYYSHSFSPAYHHFSSRLGINNGDGGSPSQRQHHHHSKNKQQHKNKHKISQTYGTEQRQVKDDGQYQYRSGYRANYGSEQYRGRLSFYDNSNKLETHDDVNRKLNGRTKEKYPYFNKVKTHLEEEDEDLPPYIKKYNRRNKQLIDLLEGTLPPQSQSDNIRRFYSHAKKNPHWMEDDLFEAQKPSKNKWSTEIEATPHPNALPDESVHVIYDEDDTGRAINNNKNKSSLTNKNNNNNKPTTFNLTASSIASNNHSPPFKLSSRAGQFVYHTVTQSPSQSNNGGIVGTSGGGGVKKKRLPFVAITDRKVGGPPRMRRRTSMNSINSNSEQQQQQQNRLTMP